MNHLYVETTHHSPAPIKLDTYEDLCALLRTTIKNFEGQADTPDMRMMMFTVIDGIASAAHARGLLPEHAAIAMNVSWPGMEPGTELLFELSRTYTLRVWTRNLEDRSGNGVTELLYASSVAETL